MSGAQLLSGIERIERLHEEKRNIEGDIKEIYAELKGNGYDTKAIRELVKRRAKDPDARSEFEAIVDLYEQEIATALRRADVQAKLHGKDLFHMAGEYHTEAMVRGLPVVTLPVEVPGPRPILDVYVSQGFIRLTPEAAEQVAHQLLAFSKTGTLPPREAVAA